MPELSFHYWRKHKAQLLLLMLILLSAVTALSLMFLFVRGSKYEKLERELTMLGDYDIIAFNTDLTAAEEASRYGGSRESGMFLRVDGVRAEGGYEVPAAAFRDRLSQEIYHLTMLRGRYPQAPDELALELQYAKACGLAPYPEGTVTAEINGTAKEYKLVGIFDAANSDSFSRNEYLGGASLPQVILDSSFYNEDGGLYTGFCRLGSVDYTQPLPKGLNYSYGRGYAYGCALGTDRWRYGGADDLDAIAELVKNGETYSDIFSLLIPLFSGLIGLASVISLYRMAVSIFEQRTSNSGLLLAIGMSRGRRLAMLICELWAAAIASLPPGMLLSVGIYKLTLHLSGGISALDAPELVCRVTYDPWLTAAVIIAAVTAAVSVLFLLRYRHSTALGLIKSKSSKVHRSRRGGGKLRVSGWFKTVFGAVAFTDIYAALLTVIGIVSLSFGLVISEEIGRFDANGTQHMIEAQVGDGADYTVSVSSENAVSPNIRLGGGQGVPCEKAESFKAEAGEMISSLKACSADPSGMMIIKNESELPDLLKDSILSKDIPELWAAAGVGEDETALSVPIVGLDSEGFESLACGAERRSVAEGKECVLAVGEYSYESIKERFKVGDEITLSLILPNEGAEDLDISCLTYEDCERYGAPVQTENGTEYCFGHRRDIRVKIGGIEVVSADSDGSFYYRSGRLNIFVLPETFKAWGLGERNLTDLSVSLREGADIPAADRAFYSMLDGCEGIKSASAAELKERYERERSGVKKTFIRLELLLLMLVVTGMKLSVFELLRKRRRTAALLRTAGMSRGRLCIISVLQNEAAVLIGTALSVLPLWGFTKLSERAFGIISGGQAGMIELDETTPHSTLTDLFLYEGWKRYELMTAPHLRTVLYAAAAFAVVAAAAAAIPILIRSRTSLVSALREE